MKDVPSETPPVVELDETVVRVDGRNIVGPVSLLMREGERWVVLGPNGGGKTTLLSVIGARLQPSSGTATVLGIRVGRGDLRALRPEIGHASHWLADRFTLGMNVRDVVLTGKRSALAPWFQEYDDDDLVRAERGLVEVGCADLRERRFATCSQGERQRALLARAMFGEPRMLVLDEPSAGLDLPARELLIAATERATRQRPALVVVLATHHLEEIPPSFTHAALLRAGSILADGPIEEVLTSDRLRSCFDIEIEVERRRGRWASWSEAVGPT